MYSQHAVSFHQTLYFVSVENEKSLLCFQLSPPPQLPSKHTDLRLNQMVVLMAKAEVIV
jgi:hypothetical protein